jgi:Dyp-type peroxidase family
LNHAREVMMAEQLNATALGDIQGFITSGYGHLPRARYLFLHVQDADQGRAYLAQLLSHVTTAAPWPSLEGRKLKPTWAINVAITASGLGALDLPERVRCTFPAEFQEGITPLHRSAILGDTEESAPEQWEFGGPAHQPIHLVVMIHGASETEADEQCSRHRELVAGVGGAVTEVTETQGGYRPANDHEPFGFHDGIAQPSIRGIGGDGVPTGEFVLGYENHYGLVPPGPVVPDDVRGSMLLPRLANPYHAGARLRDLGLNGSFVVYRKLVQHVAAFWNFARHEAIRATGRADAAHMLWVASRMMGRWPSGAPLAVSPDRDDLRLRNHDAFLYDDDPDGFACPLGAHVRRTNPRAVLKPYGVAQSLSMSEAHRLLRRARVFGPPLFDATVLQDARSGAAARVLHDLAEDGVPRGIHFFSVNASIRSQFEFVQQTWCNNPRFAGLTANKDPITGDNARTGASPSCMEVPRRPVAYRTAALPRFVTVAAGAYLFMPSITALRFLSAPTTPG